MNECVGKMPKECRELYLKFVKLKKETKNLKNNLTSLKNNKKENPLKMRKQNVVQIGPHIEEGFS